MGVMKNYFEIAVWKALRNAIKNGYEDFVFNEDVEQVAISLADEDSVIEKYIVTEKFSLEELRQTVLQFRQYHKEDRIKETVYTRVRVKCIGKNHYVIETAYKSLSFKRYERFNHPYYKYYLTFDEADKKAKEIFEEENDSWRRYHLRNLENKKYKGIKKVYDQKYRSVIKTYE